MELSDTLHTFYDPVPTVKQRDLAGGSLVQTAIWKLLESQARLAPYRVF